MVLEERTVPDTLVIIYLQMTNPTEFSPSYLNDSAVTIVPMQPVDVPSYRFLYSEVGRPWRWRDRLLLTDEQLEEILTRRGTSVHVLYVEAVPAGYVELVAEESGSTEIAYFGLRAEFIGRGLGKHLLSYAIEQAWQGGAQRVWLHTCNLDYLYALDNYRKRGFHIYDVVEKPMPERYL